MSSFPPPPSPLRLGDAPRVAVVGGGISGLAAAHRILELLPKAELSLFEASDRLGGLLETVERDGFLIEQSADNFLSKDPTAVELCRELGIADELIPTDESRRRALVVKDGELLPIPAGFFLMSPRELWPVLKSPILSVPGKLRLLAEPFVPRRKDSDDESIASFASRRLGHETFQRLVQPLVAGIYTADAAKLSMAATMPQFFAYERDHGSLLLATLHRSATSDAASGARYGLFLAPRHGIMSIIRKLADTLPPTAIHLKTPISRLRLSPDNTWQLTLTPHPGESRGESCGPKALPFDAVILAIPTHAAARVLDQVYPELAAELAAIEYAGCTVVSMGFARAQIEHALDGFGFVVPQIENRRIIAASFASLKFPGRAPDGTVLLRTFVGGALQPELIDLSDDDLRRLVLDELSDLLKVKGAPLIVDIARWPSSMPQYSVGHVARIARIETLATRHPNLGIAGNAYHGVGIPQCIASGRSAAERIAMLT